MSPDPMSKRTGLRRHLVFIDAIRKDLPSGGRTATDTLMRQLGSPDCSIMTISAAPNAWPRTFALLNLPGSFFVWWSRRRTSVWSEFATRLSPVLVVRCWLAMMRHPRSLLVLNHHSVFYLAHLVPWAQKVYVWHDVPSLKRDARVDVSRSARLCASIERLVTARNSLHLTYSADDRKWLQRLHRMQVVLCPALDVTPSQRVQVVPGSVLMIGNWLRPENRDGALQFFTDLTRMRDADANTDHVAIHIAGAGAGELLQQMNRQGIFVDRLKVTPRYASLSDFDEAALLVPLLRGAGIKLKTLEAWAAGIPVIGTAQAFTGLPRDLVRLGGARVPNIEGIARICLDRKRVDQAIEGLRPALAFRAYQSMCFSDQAPDFASDDERCRATPPPPTVRRCNLLLSVVSHGQGPLLIKLLQDLKPILSPDVKLVVTINRPEPEDFLAEFEGLIEVIRNPVPLGFGANHNQASRCLNWDFFAVLNPDLRCTPTVFAALQTALLEGSIGVCGPVVTDRHGQIEDSARLEPSASRILHRLWLRLTGQRTQPDYPLAGQGLLHVDWIAGMCMVFCREAFEAVGGFDDSYFMYLEDTDICRRIRRAGWFVAVQRDVRVVHDAQRASQRDSKHLRWHLTSMARFLWLPERRKISTGLRTPSSGGSR